MGKTDDSENNGNDAYNCRDNAICGDWSDHHHNSVEFRQWDDLASGSAKHNLACRL